MKKKLKSLVPAILPILFLAACDGDNELDLLFNDARVLVIHASPDGPALDLFVDDTRINVNALNYPDNTGYMDIDTGDRNFKVSPATTGAGGAVIEENLTLEENQAYSIFAVNTVGNMEALVLEDDFTQPVSGKAHVRFLNLSPDAPAIDIAFKDSTVIFSNIKFKENAALTPIDAGTYTWEIRPAGITDTIRTARIQLANRGIYTIYTKGFVAPPTSNADSLGIQVIVNK